MNNGASQGNSNGGGAAYPYRYAEQYSPPEPQRVSDVALTTFEHVFEVDPRLMQRWVLQQTFPNWDSLRIMNSRHDHLDWMHRHFAGTVINGSSVLSEIDAQESANSPAESTTNVWFRPETD
jgi:hypothetical protein